MIVLLITTTQSTVGTDGFSNLANTLAQKSRDT